VQFQKSIYGIILVHEASYAYHNSTCRHIDNAILATSNVTFKVSKRNAKRKQSDMILSKISNCGDESLNKVGLVLSNDKLIKITILFLGPQLIL
jgi:hypothetical protein